MNVAQDIKQAIAQALGSVGIEAALADIVLEHPAELAHGDYATSVALKYAKQAAKSPRDLAASLVEALGAVEGVSKIDIAGPGFINFTLSSQALTRSLEDARSQDMWGSVASRAGETVVVEYTDPNPFKAFHIGHLMSNTIGEAISRVLQFSGAKVVRANYQGDLGVHVACAIWGIRKLVIHPESADEFGRAYAAGAAAYKEDETAKREIDEINKKLYERSDIELNNIYDTGRAESLSAFQKIYDVLGTRFDRLYFESETAPIGTHIVLANADIFLESDGARVFHGEQYGLHTRVFVSRQGLPTYEAKELGLAKLKSDEYPGAIALYVITANEVTDYFRVVKQALSLVYPDIAKKLTHIPHGMMKLPSGKMSSRTGDVITGESLLNELAEAAKARAAESRADDHDKLAQQIAVAAIKYQILKQGSGKDIIFDRERALSLEGDSGPYLQYAYARTNAIIAKAQEQGVTPVLDREAAPSEVTRLLHRFPEIAQMASQALEPHMITQYLLSVASAFNSWYAQEQILDCTPAAAHKVAITEAVNRTLKNGLWILGIPAPEKM